MNPRLVEKLNAVGITPTPQRLAVFEAVSARADHPSVETLFRDLRENLPTLSKTTVDSTLQLLASRHLIGSLHLDDEEIRYDGTPASHAHFKCRRCGKVFDLKPRPPHRADRRPLPPGFVCEDEEVTYYGRCPACSAPNDRSEDARQAAF